MLLKDDTGLKDIRELVLEVGGPLSKIIAMINIQSQNWLRSRVLREGLRYYSISVEVLARYF